MRFCPFCAQENSDDASECAHCGRRLPHVSTGNTSKSIALPPPRSARPAPPRPIPRTRPVAPLPQPVAPETTPRSKRGTLLGMPSDPDLSTRVESSPFEGDTAAQPRLEPEESASHVAIAPESTQPNDRIDDEEPTVGRPRHVITQRDEKALFEEMIPTGVHREVPRPSGPPPLPPLPVVEVPARLDSITSERPPLLDEPIDDIGLPEAFPAESTSIARPRAPAPIATTTMSAQVTEPPDPQPMPPSPGPGLLPAVTYLVPLLRATWARHRVQRQLRTLLHDDQRLVDDTLHELGRVAWEEPTRPAELRSELGRADDDDRIRREEDAECGRVDLGLSAERERFAVELQQRTNDVAARTAQVARLGDDLAERKRAQRTEDKSLRELDRRYRDAEKSAQQLFVKAQKAQLAPPDKGGGPNAAMNLRQQGEAAQREADGYRPERDEAEARVRALDGPIAELEAQLGGERQDLSNAQAELSSAKRAHANALAALEGERTAHEERRAIAERSIRLRLVSTGTILNLHRLDGPRFVPVYARLDQLRATSVEREHRIARLEAEWRGYDRNALHIGLMVLAGTLGLGLMLLIVLVRFVTR